MLGVVGRSGAGKTTLLKILAGLELPSEGRLLYRGREVGGRGAAELRKRATMLFQSPVFLRGDVYTNLAFGLRIRGVPEGRIREEVAEALGRVRLEGFEEREARSLSGGEQQRAALARALLLDPEAILLDEPTSNLDPANSSIMAEVIEEEGEGRCVVMATHDYSQVRRLAQRTVYLEEGRVVEEGATEKMLSGSRLASLENVFTGQSRVVEGVSHVDVGGGLEVKAAFSRHGRVVIHVSPEAIILSKGWVETSARNEFRGRVTAVEDMGAVVRLRLDVGRVFTVQITKRSFSEMGLNVGSEVYMSFKASSVELI